MAAIAQSNATNASSGSSPLTATFTSANTSGNTLFAIVVSFDSSPTSFAVSDSANGTYSVANSVATITGSTTGHVVKTATYYFKNCATAAANSNTVTFSWSGTNSNGVGLIIGEISGLGSTTSIDVTASNSGQGVNNTPNPVVDATVAITTTNASDFIVVGAASWDDFNTTPAGGFTNITINSGFGLADYQGVSSTGTYTDNNSGGTHTGGAQSDVWIMQAVAFTVGGGGTINPSVSGNIAVTGSVVVSLAYSWTVPGNQLVTGTVNPTLSGGNTLNVNITGSFGVSGAVQQTLSIPVSGTSTVVATLQPSLAIPIAGLSTVSGVVSPSLVSAVVAISGTFGVSGIVRPLGGSSSGGVGGSLIGAYDFWGGGFS